MIVINTYCIPIKFCTGYVNHRTGGSCNTIGSVYSLQLLVRMHSSLSYILLLVVCVGSYDDACTTVDNIPCVFPFTFQVFSKNTLLFTSHKNARELNTQPVQQLETQVEGCGVLQR